MDYGRYELIIKARRALQEMWNKEAWLKGRCWGPKREGNPYVATNITFAIGNELVSISQRGDKLIIHEFCKQKNTELGKEIKKILRLSGIETEE